MNPSKETSTLVRTYRHLPSHRIAVACLGLTLASASWAHHSQVEFDFKSVVEVAGTVKELDWRSPHARLYVDVVDDQGKVVD